MKVNAQKILGNIAAIKARFEHYNASMGGEDDMLDMLEELEKALTPGALVLVEAYPTLKKLSSEGRYDALQPALREAFIRSCMIEAEKKL